MRGQHRAGSRREAPGRHRGARRPWQPPAALSSVTGAAAAVTVVVAIAPSVVSGGGERAEAVPGADGSARALVSSSTAEPVAVRSRPAFAGHRAGGGDGRRDTPLGPVPKGQAPGEQVHQASTGPAPGSGDATATAGGDGAHDHQSPGSDDDTALDVEVQVGDDEVVVDSGVTGPVEVPLPLPSLGS